MNSSFIRIVAFYFIILLPLFGLSQPTINQDEQLANQYLQNKEYDKALVLYEKLFETKPSYYYYVPFLNSLIEMKEYEKAEKVIKRQVKKNNDNYFYKVDLGYIYLLSGEFKKKDKYFETLIIELLPLPQHVRDLANAFINRNEYDWAIKTYLHARKISKGEQGYYLELADLYLKKGDYSMMVEQYLDAISINFEMIINAQNILQDIISDDSKGTKTEILKKALLKRIQNNSSEVIYSEMLLWLFTQTRDFDAAFNQAKALDKRLKSDGEKVIELAKTCLTNENYDIAIKCYKYVIELGKEKLYYINAKVDLANTMFKKITSVPNFSIQEIDELAILYQSTLDELGKNGGSVFLARDFAHLQAFFQNKSSEAISLIEEMLSIQGLNQIAKAECKLELADIYVLVGEMWEATLLYGQVEKQFKNEPLGHLAKFKNAQLSFYKGDFLWAQAQLNVLKAATSKLIANDALQLSMIIIDNIDPDSGYFALEKFAKADLYIAQHKYDSANAMLDSIKILFLTHPIFDEVLFKKAEISEKTGKYQEAAALYQKVVENHGTDILGDDALYRLAQLQDKVFKDYSKAMESYQEILVKYPGSVFTVEARKRFRTLRGDNIQ